MTRNDLLPTHKQLIHSLMALSTLVLAIPQVNAQQAPAPTQPTRSNN